MAPRILVLSVTPLKVRTTLNRLRRCDQPWKLLYQLLWPYPWHFKLPTPATIDDLERNGNEILHSHQSGMLQMFNIPLFRSRDTPLRSLYRLYEDLCSNDLIFMSYECEYFFFRKGPRWKVSQIPDPKDPDPIRYAILASMADALVDAFNWRLELGLRRDRSIDESKDRATNFERESAPTWTATVGPLEKRLDFDVFKDDPNDVCKTNKAFLKRNMRGAMGYLYTV